MLTDLLFALRRFRWDQVKYWRHTYSPLSPWRRSMVGIVETVTTEATRYGVHASLDPRRNYQLARGVIANRRGEHLVDQVPDAYQQFSPPSAATFHAGRRHYDPPADRRRGLLRHPQTLAYVLTPPRLSRLGVGASPPGGLVVIQPGEAEITQELVVSRLQELTGGRATGADLRAYAELLLRLHSGLPHEQAGTEQQAA